jgi:spore germination protein YaaH
VASICPIAASLARRLGALGLSAGLLVGSVALATPVGRGAIASAPVPELGARSAVAPGVARVAVAIAPATAAGDASGVPAAHVVAARSTPPSSPEPSQEYLDLLAHAGDPNHFSPGGRVTVGFKPRAGETWRVAGAAPRALPAGAASGAQMLAGPLVPGASPVPSTPPAPVDAPAGGESIPATGASFVAPTTLGDAARLDATSLQRDVYGFLPYWEVSSAQLDFAVLSHVAYFGVGTDAAGNLGTKNSDGTPTTGWAGWTSSAMTTIINAAHASHTRVTLTVEAMAWTSSSAAVQQALLASPTARLNLADQIVAAVRNRGADGVNLDFEPLVTGSEAGFVALIRTIRSEFNKASAGYHVTFDTLGQPANYPLEAALAPGGADAVFIMGYDYRTASSPQAGSVDPLGGPAYDLTDTVLAYKARVPASQVILGVPYYGRAWSTVSDLVNAKTQDPAKYGASVAAVYSTAVDLAAQYGRRFDSRETSAWAAYQRQYCTPGCVTTWRQLYYDDADTLRARYDMVNASGIRGVGIWALGYDGTRTELNQALADKFVASGATYVPLTPARILDTRVGNGLGGAFSSHAARTFGVAGRGGVPANAVAVTGNLTVTAQTASGYVYLGPGATNNPTSSTLNFPLRDDRANGVTVALGAGGTLSATYVAATLGPTTQVIFDVTGYFVPDTSGATYVPLTPVRLLDTRSANGLSGAFSSHAARTFGVAGRGGVPANAVAVTGNLTVTAQTASGYVYLGPGATNNPTSSTLNFPLRDDRANGVTVALGAGGTLSATYVAATLGPTTQVIFDVTGYFQ